jgi:hypothetical protein
MVKVVAVALRKSESIGLNAVSDAPDVVHAVWARALVLATSATAVTAIPRRNDLRVMGVLPVRPVAPRCDESARRIIASLGSMTISRVVTQDGLTHSQTRTAVPRAAAAQA